MTGELPTPIDLKPKLIYNESMESCSRIEKIEDILKYYETNETLPSEFFHKFFNFPICETARNKRTRDLSYRIRNTLLQSKIGRAHV